MVTGMRLNVTLCVHCLSFVYFDCRWSLGDGRILHRNTNCIVLNELMEDMSYVILINA